MVRSNLQHEPADFEDLPEDRSANLPEALSSAAIGGNRFTSQVAQQRQLLAALHRVERVRGLHRNAEQAAFTSLMRRRGSGGAAAGTPQLALAEAPTPAASVTTAFEKAVALRLTQATRPGRLDYSARLALLRHAAALGLSRFDANLLIARVEHYHAQQRPGSGRNPRPPRSRRWLLWGTIVGAVLLIQGVLVVLWIRVLG